MSGVVEVLGGLASVVSLLDISAKIHGKCPQVTQNQAEYRGATERIVRAAEQIDELLKENPSLVNIQGLVRGLEALSLDLHRVYKKLSKIFKERPGKAGRIKTVSKQWWSSGDIRLELERIERQMTAFHQQFSIGTMARIELQTHETTQAITRVGLQNEEGQATLRAIEEKMSALVLSLEKDDRKAADVLGIQNMTTPEMKTALKKSSMDLSREGIAEADARYLKLKIKVLEQSLQIAEKDGIFTGPPTTTTSFDVVPSYPLKDKGLPSDTHYPKTGDPAQETEDTMLEAIRLTSLLRDAGVKLSPVDLAGALHNLELTLGDLGWIDEALTLSQWGTNLRRKLVQAGQPAEFFLDFTVSLNNLSVRLALAGRNKEALAAVEEAVAIYRGFAICRPDLDLPGLGPTLINLSLRLADVGRHNDALIAIQEAEAILRKFAEDQPATFLPDLASSLDHLSARLADVGQHSEAVKVIEEAVAIRQKLAKDQPTVFLPFLASSLNSLSLRLSDAGQHSETLKHIEEAEVIYRKLAHDRPAAFLPDLARSLHNLSLRLADAGRHSDALDAIEEAEKIFRKFAKDQPAAFLPLLSDSLNSLSLLLTNAGRYDEAFEAVEEAESIYRKLSEDQPASFLPSLGHSLYNLSLCLTNLSRHTDALKTIGEAEAIYRRLAEDRCAILLPHLSDALVHLSLLLAHAGRDSEALEANAEAEAIRQRLAEDRRATSHSGEHALPLY